MTQLWRESLRLEAGEELSCWVAEEFGSPEFFGEIVFGETTGK